MGTNILTKINDFIAKERYRLIYIGRATRLQEVTAVTRLADLPRTNRVLIGILKNDRHKYNVATRLAATLALINTKERSGAISKAGIDVANRNDEIIQVRIAAARTAAAHVTYENWTDFKTSYRNWPIQMRSGALNGLGIQRIPSPYLPEEKLPPPPLPADMCSFLEKQIRRSLPEISVAATLAAQRILRQHPNAQDIRALIIQTLRHAHPKTRQTAIEWFTDPDFPDDFTAPEIEALTRCLLTETVPECKEGAILGLLDIDSTLFTPTAISNLLKAREKEHDPIAAIDIDYCLCRTGQKNIQQVFLNAINASKDATQEESRKIVNEIAYLIMYFVVYDTETLRSIEPIIPQIIAHRATTEKNSRILSETLKDMQRLMPT